jgi:plastocyanin
MNASLLTCRTGIGLLVPGLLLLLGACRPNGHKLYTVQIKDMKFQPSVLDIHEGDTVMWINRDIVAHDVTEESNNAWSSTPLATGKSWKKEFSKSTSYFCNIHQVMKGRIQVQ